jgi:hypothetical protein
MGDTFADVRSFDTVKGHASVVACISKSSEPIQNYQARRELGKSRNLAFGLPWCPAQRHILQRQWSVGNRYLTF